MKRKLLPMLLLILMTSMSFAQVHTIKVTVPDTTIVCFAVGTFNNWSPFTGIPMTKISDSPKMFSASIDFGVPVSSLNTVEYKFLTGPDWSYQQTASANFNFLTDSASAVVSSFQAIYDTTQAADVTIDVLVPDSVYQLNLTGTFNNWDPIANAMSMVDSSVNGKEFKLTLHVPDTLTLEYKFVAGPGWDYQQTADSNFNYKDDGGTVVCDLFQAIFNPSLAGDITVNITVPVGTPAVYLIGSFNNWTTSTAIQATKITDTTYTAVIPHVQNVTYKCYNYPDWPYEEAIDAAGNSVPDRPASYLTSNVVNIRVAYWKSVFTGLRAINHASPDYKLYSIYGKIIVERVNSTVAIFDLNGRMIQNARIRGTFTSKNLPAGLYILRIDNSVGKIVIR